MWQTLLIQGGRPQEWLAAHLDPPPIADGPWVTLADLTGDGAAGLRRIHTRMVGGDGTPPAAATKWLASWFAGWPAAIAGLVCATGSAALLVRGEEIRFRLHPDGWPEHCDVGTPRVATVAGHPWSGQPGVLVVEDEQVLARLAVTAVREAVGPLVAACATLAKVGRAALWTEVVDGFGLPVLDRFDLPVEPAAVARLRHVVRAEGRPWRRFPELRVADTPVGPAYVGRKAGCCLSYLCPQPDDEQPDLHDVRERFPEDGRPRYCDTCSLRDLAGCEERQVFRLQRERPVQTGTG